VKRALQGKPASSLAFAVPDHPWVESSDGADVRIAMTVLELGERDGVLATVTTENITDSGYIDVYLISRSGRIQEDLSIGASVAAAHPLKANSLVASTGLILGSRGFVLTSEEARRLSESVPPDHDLIFPLRHGRDITDIPRNVYVIDTHGWPEDSLRTRLPAIYQHLFDRVYPERQTNRDPRLRRNWWLFRRSNEQVRSAISGLTRYIVTSETARHRVFVFLEARVKPEHKLVVIGSKDAYHLGVLSSRPHVCWALAAGGHLGVGNDPVYSKNTCFDAFAFPEPADDLLLRIRDLGEQLDAHRKQQQAQHPTLTITDMYNVLERLRANQPLSDRERVIHEQGLVSVLKQIHDDLDAAVFEAYGWPSSVSDEEILMRLVALNAERATEEAQGVIRWLRPEFQNPTGHRAATQTNLIDEAEEEAVAAPAKKAKLPWPKTLPERAQAVRTALAAQRSPVTPEQLAKTFLRANVDKVEELLDTLASLGQARELADGRFVSPLFNVGKAQAASPQRSK
jgi:hypothetical protein